MVGVETLVAAVAPLAAAPFALAWRPLVWLALAGLLLLAAALAALVAVGFALARGLDLRAAARLAPDLAHLLRALARDPESARGVRVRLVILLAYLASPIDIVPDFVPVLGQVDDVILIGLVLRHVVRRAGPAAVERHWQGTPEGLAIVRRLAGLGET